MQQTIVNFLSALFCARPRSGQLAFTSKVHGVCRAKTRQTSRSEVSAVISAGAILWLQTIIILDFIIKTAVSQRISTREELFDLERKAAKKFNADGFPKDWELLKRYKKLVRQGEIEPYEQLEEMLITSKTSSLSGIAPLTCLTKPFPCPGDCFYCPDAQDMPKSYLRGEPAAERAYLTDFDPYRQVKVRLDSFQKTGHATDKIELIILGGTWSFYPKKYKEWFIANLFAAANGSEKIGRDEREAFIEKRLNQEQKKNEKAQNRIIGLTLETRPDWVSEKEIKHMRRLGATRIELGLQSVYDDVLHLNMRGHGIAESKRAIKLLKDAGLKINAHIMLNLPGSNIKKDEEMFAILFDDANLRPDWLKIYPCVVLKGAPLYKAWKEGKFKPYSQKDLRELLIRIKQKIPRYVRITRLIRDIPSPAIVAGNKKTNLREIVQKELDRRGLKCQCIRCREVRGETKDEKLKLFRQDYDASGGKEVFLSYEDPKRKRLYALLRLRIPSYYFSGKKHFISVLDDCGIVRELHTYGVEISLGTKNKKAAQHKGLGKKLMKHAEKIAKEDFNISKLAVISGIGVREYYRKLGYKLEGEYMVKDLKQEL